MMIRLIPVFALSAALVAPMQLVQAEDAKVVLDIKLQDGSRLQVEPVEPTIRIYDGEEEEEVDLAWSEIEEMQPWMGRERCRIDFVNTALVTYPSTPPKEIEVDATFGRIKVSFEEIQDIKVRVNRGAENLALGKPVRTADEDATDPNDSFHVTDGKSAIPTVAAPSKIEKSEFDYRVDLQHKTHHTYCVESIVINWGVFGDRFRGLGGCRGVKPDEVPGEYVTFYEVDYRRKGSNIWVPVHDFEGRPVEEEDRNVVFHKKGSKTPSHLADVTTRLLGLNLEEVAELRVRAKGDRKIDLIELEVYGYQEE